MKKIVLTSLILLMSNVFAYEFNYNNHQFNYDENTLKFYEENKLLGQDELKQIFPDREIILISQFNDKKKLKLKNSFFKSKKILLLNDTQRTFYGFYVYPETARFENSKVKSLITIHGKKNVRLKHSGGDEFEITIR